MGINQINTGYKIPRRAGISHRSLSASAHASKSWLYLKSNIWMASFRSRLLAGSLGLISATDTEYTDDNSQKAIIAHRSRQLLQFIEQSLKILPESVI